MFKQVKIKIKRISTNLSLTKTMAECKYVNTEDLTEVTSGSEPVSDQVCQPCGNKAVLEAVGFCMDCQEWLCEECFSYHRRLKVCRNHELKDLEQMKANPTSARGQDRCIPTCDKHRGKRLKYFCTTHEFPGCSACFIQEHRGCAVESISDLARDVFKTPEYTYLEDRFKNVTTTSQETQDKVNCFKIQSAKQHVVVKQAIWNYWKKLTEIMKQMKQDLEEKCAVHEQQELEKLEYVGLRCKNAESQSQAVTDQMDVLKGKDQTCGAFLAMKQASTKIQQLEDTVKEARTLARISDYIFKPSRELFKEMKSPRGMGVLNENKTLDKIYSNLSAEHLKDISVVKNGDSKCLVTGMALLSPHRLVLADCNNHQIKLIDTDTDIIISSMILDYQPWSVTTVNEETFVVPVNNTILTVKVDHSGKLFEEKSFNVNELCMHVAFHDDKMIVCFQDPDKIKVLDMTGCVLHTLIPEGKGRSILYCPQYLALSQDKESVFVSNLGNNSVVCLKLDGTVVVTYMDDELQGPEQMAVDEHGSVSVSAWYSKNVHIITPDCQKIKVILSETDGLENVKSISYCEERRRLYIGMDSNLVKVFQLS